MNERTPGPWTVEKYDNVDHGYCGWNVASQDGDSVAEAVDYPYYCIRSEADACLIAAAPDLLAALKECLDKLEFHGYPEMRGIVFEAIAKAEGK